MIQLAYLRAFFNSKFIMESEFRKVPQFKIVPAMPSDQTSLGEEGWVLSKFFLVNEQEKRSHPSELAYRRIEQSN